MKSLLLLTSAALLASPASAQLEIADFENALNLGSWTYGNGNDTVEATGGNPDGYFHNSNVDTFAPQLRTQGSSVFTGDWRAQGVTDFGFDLRTFSTNFIFAREASVILSNGGCSVYHLGTQMVPQVNENWKSIDYSIDSQSTTIPAGWFVQFGCGSDDATWDAVIQNVQEVRVFYGDPTFFFIFDQWNVGADNIRINKTPPIQGYCTTNSNSTGSPATMTWAGEPSVAANNLTLAASPLPSNVNGIFYYGTGTNNVPFGDGVRCVGGQTFRLPIKSSGTSGQLVHDLDLNNPPNPPSGQVMPGSTWYYQAWFRDQTGGPSGFNLSNGLEVNWGN